MVVCREYSHTCGWQCTEGSAIFLRDRVHAHHEFLVLALGVVDQGHTGLSHRSQTSNFAGVVHAQLHHRTAVVGTQTQQGLRHANLVVQIAQGRQRVVTPACAQDAGDHLCHCGFAVAARHGNQGQGKLRPPSLCQLPQCTTAVWHFYPGQLCRFQAMLRQRSHGTAGSGLGQEVVCVKTLALQGHKQVTGLQAAAVGVHALHLHGGVATHARVGEPAGDLRQAEVHVMHAPSTAARPLEPVAHR